MSAPSGVCITTRRLFYAGKLYRSGSVINAKDGQATHALVQQLHNARYTKQVLDHDIYSKSVIDAR